MEVLIKSVFTAERIVKAFLDMMRIRNEYCTKENCGLLNLVKEEKMEELFSLTKNLPELISELKKLNENLESIIKMSSPLLGWKVVKEEEENE